MVTMEQNAFLSWFQSWGQVVYVAAQVLFWAGLAVAAVIIALQYRRYVSYRLGADSRAPEAPASDAAAAPAEPAPSVSVEEFVE